MNLKLSRCLLLTALLSMIASCSQQPVYGAYVFGHELETITLCQTGRTYWIDASPTVKSNLRKAHQELTTMPDQSIYVGVSGFVMDKQATGFAEPYGSYFRVEEVHDVRVQRPEVCGLPK